MSLMWISRTLSTEKVYAVSVAMPLLSIHAAPLAFVRRGANDLCMLKSTSSSGHTHCRVCKPGADRDCCKQAKMKQRDRQEQHEARGDPARHRKTDSWSIAWRIHAKFEDNMALCDARQRQARFSANDGYTVNNSYADLWWGLFRACKGRSLSGGCPLCASQHVAVVFCGLAFALCPRLRFVFMHRSTVDTAYP